MFKLIFVFVHDIFLGLVGEEKLHEFGDFVEKCTYRSQNKFTNNINIRAKPIFIDVSIANVFRIKSMTIIITGASQRRCINSSFIPF